MMKIMSIIFGILLLAISIVVACPICQPVGIVGGADPIPPPLVWYQMETNADPAAITLDTSSLGNNYTGLVVGASWEFTGTNGYYNFDATGCYISITNAVTITNGATLSAWIKPAIGADGAIVGKFWDGSKRAWFWTVNKSAGGNFFEQEFNYRAAGEGSDTIISERSDADTNWWTVGEWHHVVVVLGETNITFWTDGQNLEGSKPLKNLQVNTKDMQIGDASHQTVQPYRPFEGGIDDVAPWGQVLSSNEVQTLYNRNPTD